MDLGSGWFGGRPRLVSAQLREAAELEFAGLALAPGDPPVDLQGVEEAHRDTGIPVSAASWSSLAPEGQPDDRSIPLVRQALRRLRCAAVVVACGRPVAADTAARGERVVARVRAGELLVGDEAVEQLAALLADTRGRGLEEFARTLHGIHGALDGAAVAVVAEANPASLLDPASLALLLEDPALSWLTVWHDVGVIQTRHALGLEDPGAWLQCHPERISGCSLQDWAQGRDRLLPGEGEVDWPLLAEYLPGQARRVLTLAPSYPGDAVHEARLALASLGIR